MDYKIIILTLLSFSGSYLMIPFLIALSKRFDISDETGKRKRHTRAVSMLGGVPLFIVLFLSTILFSERENFLSQFYVLLSFSILFITGLYDDIRPLNATKKLFFQIIAALIIVYLADIHHSAYFTKLAISEDLIRMVSVVFIIFVINAYNLVDGINGLSALLSMLAVMGFGIWFYAAGFYGHAYVCFMLSASIVAFLRFNLFNTRIFLGDNGSMLLGLATAYFSIVLVQYNQNADVNSEFKLIAPFGLVIGAMAIPIMDTLRLFIMRSLYLQKSPFKADRNHLHHYLLRLGFSHFQASMTLTSIAACLLAFAFFAQMMGNTGVLFIIVLIYITVLIALDYFIFNLYRKKLPKKTVFNELEKIKTDLNNPLVYEFFFALSFFVLAVSIPFHRVSASIPTILVGLSFVVVLIAYYVRSRGNFKSIFKAEAAHFFRHPYSLIILMFIVWYGIHYTCYPAGKSNALSIKLLLLVYWLPFFELRKVINIKPLFILRAYIYGCFGFSIFILYHALFSFHELGWDAFFYSDLLDYVKANPITHSLYFNLAIVFSIANLKSIKSKMWKVVHISMLGAFVIMVILCASKLGYIALLVLSVAGIMLMVKRTLNRVLFIAGFAMIAMLSYQYVPYLNNRVDGFIWQIERHDKISMEYRLPRSIIWKEAISLIKENWLFGTGVGNSMNILEDRYRAIGYEKGAKHRFNCHNQFLESFLQTGIAGFLLLLSMFFYSIKVALKQKSVVYALFLITILLYMMIESLFETQMGMVAFAFFNALFLSSFIKHIRTHPDNS